MNECTLNALGGVQIYIYDKNNNLKQYVKTHNRVVDTGCEMIAPLIAGPTADSNFIDTPVAMALGGNITNVISNDTKLHEELIRKRFDKVERVGPTVHFTTTFLPGEPHHENTNENEYHYTKFCEVGIFNSDIAKSGTMLNRAVFAVLQKGDDDTVKIIWSVTIVGLDSKFDRAPLTTGSGVAIGE